MATIRSTPVQVSGIGAAVGDAAAAACFGAAELAAAGAGGGLNRLAEATWVSVGCGGCQSAASFCAFFRSPGFSLLAVDASSSPARGSPNCCAWENQT